MTIKPRSAGGRWLAAIPLALILAVGMISSASATEKLPVWRSGEAAITFGKQFSVSGESIHGLNLHWKVSSQKFWIQCETLAASGVAENSVSGKPGTLENLSGTFKGCRLVEGAQECTVPKELPVKWVKETIALSTGTYSQGGMRVKGELEFHTENCVEGLYPYLTRANFNANGYETGSLAEQLFPESSSTVTVNLGTNATIEFGMRLAEGSNGFSIGLEEVGGPYGHHWYRGGGVRQGEGPKTLVTAGTPLAIAKGSTKLTLETVTTGIPVKFSCTGAGGVEGSVENPTGGGDGTGNVALTFNSCAVTAPAGLGCVVEGGAIKTGALPGVISNPLAERPLLKFSPASGELLSAFQVTGCSEAAFNGNWNMKGNLFVYPQMNSGLQPGSWSIPSPQNSIAAGTLRLRGQAAQASGEVVAETSSGEAVTLG